MTLDMETLTLMRTQKVKCAPEGTQLVVYKFIFEKVIVPNEVTQYCIGYILIDRDITEI